MSTPHPPSAVSTSTNDLRIAGFGPLTPPGDLLAELPLGDERAALVRASRVQVASIMSGHDDRLLVVVGPCSVHDPAGALDYAQHLARTSAELSDHLRIVMRVYFEKPRTTVGWKGLINDPGLDGTHDVARGLRLARGLLLDVLDAGLPVGCEFLEPIGPQYIADAVSWGAIGARTPESQVHRQLASGLSMPVGFKNATDGAVQAAVDGCTAAASGHVFFGVDDHGHASVVSTTGNPDCHVILRGGRTGPNFESAHVQAARTAAEAAGVTGRVVIDASHGNSGKDHLRQAEVASAIAGQIGDGEDAAGGVMLESFLLAGRQDVGDGPLTYGQSITDACMSWATTESVLGELAAAVQARRRR